MERFAKEMKSIIKMADGYGLEARAELEKNFMKNAKPGETVPKVLPHDELWESAVRHDYQAYANRIDSLASDAYRRLGFERTEPLSREADSTITNFESMDDVTESDIEALYERYGSNRIARSRLSRLAAKFGKSIDDPTLLKEHQIRQMSEVAKNAVWSGFYRTTGIESPTNKDISPDWACTIIDNAANGIVGLAAYLSDGSGSQDAEAAE